MKKKIEIKINILKKIMILLIMNLLFASLPIKADNSDFYIAEKHYEKGEYSEAKKYYEKYLKKNKQAKYNI